ncbi:hypothetical protein KAU33_15725 [Candidatus Dependentiae bacterium]|nr:hypothetical protein [Candidatus Dependentiae bacterium]
MRIKHVDTFLSLAYRENGFMTAKSGRLLKIHKNEEGNFGMGWKVEYFRYEELNSYEKRLLERFPDMTMADLAKGW